MQELIEKMDILFDKSCEIDQDEDKVNRYLWLDQIHRNT